MKPKLEIVNGRFESHYYDEDTELMYIGVFAMDENEMCDDCGSHIVEVVCIEPIEDKFIRAICTDCLIETVV